MTPDEAYLSTRDVFARILHAQAAAQGLTLSVPQIVGMLDRAMETAGVRVLLTAAASADGAAAAYSDAYELPPSGDLETADGQWRAARDSLSAYPNLAGLTP